MQRQFRKARGMAGSYQPAYINTALPSVYCSCTLLKSYVASECALTSVCHAFKIFYQWASPGQLCEKTAFLVTRCHSRVTPRRNCLHLVISESHFQSAEVPPSLPRCSYPGRENEGAGGWNENCSHSNRFPQGDFCLLSSELEWFTFCEEEAHKPRNYACCSKLWIDNKLMTYRGMVLS